MMIVYMKYDMIWSNNYKLPDSVEGLSFVGKFETQPHGL